MQSTIPHESAIEAVVNDPDAPVTLYDPDTAEAIQVHPGRVAAWLRRGWTRTPQDLATVLSDVVAQADALDAPWRAYAEACRAAGRIDSAAQDTAHAALELFSQACDRLHRALHASYPPPAAAEAADAA